MAGRRPGSLVSRRVGIFLGRSFCRRPRRQARQPCLNRAVRRRKIWIPFERTRNQNVGGCDPLAKKVGPLVKGSGDPLHHSAVIPYRDGIKSLAIERPRDIGRIGFPSMEGEPAEIGAAAGAAQGDAKAGLRKKVRKVERDGRLFGDDLAIMPQRGHALFWMRVPGVWRAAPVPAPDVAIDDLIGRSDLFEQPNEPERSGVWSVKKRKHSASRPGMASGRTDEPVA
jgi:hypothetical protein